MMILTEIGWLAKASLIALETAVESRRASVSDSAYNFSCLLYPRPPEIPAKSTLLLCSLFCVLLL